MGQMSERMDWGTEPRTDGRGNGQVPKAKGRNNGDVIISIR